MPRLLNILPELRSTWVVGSLAMVAVGCADWPRYKNRPTTSSAALEPGQTPSDGLNVTFSDTIVEEEPNDEPISGTPLEVGQGWSLEGTLTGLGWDSSLTVERASECGEARAFPPAAPGNYTGDVDWIALNPTAPGILCLDLLSDHDTARLDVALYVLDDCNEPVGVFVHPGSDAPIGIDVAATHTRWAIPVDDTVNLAVGIAGFWPDDPELELEWDLTLALVPSFEGASDSLCPDVP
jgi:hypothetical protein